MNLKKNLLVFCVVSLLAASLLSGCKAKDYGSMTYKDGTYTGVYEDEDEHSKSSVEVTLKIEGGRIVDCQYVEKDKDGKVKGADYGKEAGEAKYRLAQLAVEGAQTYPGQLLEKQNPDEMDAVSGATVSFKCFQQAVYQALDKAAK